MGFSYRPISWQGWLVLAAMGAVFFSFGLMFLHLRDPVASWLCGGVAVGAAIVGNGVVLWKVERD